MNLKLRKAEKDEILILQTISKDVIDKNYRDSLGDEAVDFFIGSGEADRYVQENIGNTAVAVLEDEIVGMCVCRENLVDLLMVKNELQAQGIGSELLRRVGEALFSTYPQIRVECFEKNVKANRFYVKNGWQQEKIVFDEEIGDNRVYYYKMRQE